MRFHLSLKALNSVWKLFDEDGLVIVGLGTGGWDCDSVLMQIFSDELHPFDENAEVVADGDHARFFAFCFDVIEEGCEWSEGCFDVDW